MHNIGHLQGRRVWHHHFGGRRLKSLGTPAFNRSIQDDTERLFSLVSTWLFGLRATAYSHPPEKFSPKAKTNRVQFSQTKQDRSENTQQLLMQLLQLMTIKNQEASQLWSFRFLGWGDDIILDVTWKRKRRSIKSCKWFSSTEMPERNMLWIWKKSALLPKPPINMKPIQEAICKCQVQQALEWNINERTVLPQSISPLAPTSAIIRKKKIWKAHCGWR